MYAGSVLCIVILTIVAGAAASSLGGVCAISGQEEICRQQVCSYRVINSTCGGGALTTPAVCDDIYFAAFPVLFAGISLDLYENPEREAAGYATLDEMLEWTGSLRNGQLVNCSVTNSTAYLYDGELPSEDAPPGGGNSYKKEVYGISIAVLICIALAVCTAILGAVGGAVAWLVRRRQSSDLV